MRGLVVDMCKALGDRFSGEVTFKLDVFDRVKERTLPLLSTGFATSQDQEPYRTWNDSTPQRYLIDGEIQVVPHDRCPRCWNDWDFKSTHRGCRHCGAKLGGDCKILLDSDVCPSCEKGKVSMTQPVCDQCGFEVDLDIAAWG